jgi:cytochrome P450
MGGTTKDVGAGPAEVTSLLSLPRAGADPYGRYRRLRELDPVHFNPHVGMWFLTRHASCVAVLRDRRFSAELGQGVRRRERRLPPSMLTSDPPEHGRLRRPAGEAFGERAADAFRPRVERLVDELLDALQAGEEVDLVASFTEVLSVRLLAELLGVPEQDRERFRENALAAAPNLDPLAPPDEQERGTAAAESLADLFRGLLARRGSGAGVLGALATATRARGDVSSEELVATCTLLVVGGQEPLAALVANGVLALLRHPDELRRLREDTSVDRTAVDELLRFDSPIQFAARVARADVDVGGRTIRRGDAVVALLGAANRDPAVFADPDRLDLARRPNPHLTFGAGPHLCLGAPLTRVAGRAALTTLVRRFPRLALAVDEVEWRGSLVPHAPASLRVRLR